MEGGGRNAREARGRREIRRIMRREAGERTARQESGVFAVLYSAVRPDSQSGGETSFSKSRISSL